MDYMPERTSSPDSVIGGFQMYDEIREELMKDEELLQMFREMITPDCYPDPECRTLTIDFGYYLGKYYGRDSDGWYGTEYDTGLGVDEWIDLLHDRNVFTEESLQVMKRMKNYGGSATCTQLSLRYGETANFYNKGSSSLAKRISDKIGFLVGKEDNEKYWPILYLGKPAKEER